MLLFLIIVAAIGLAFYLSTRRRTQTQAGYDQPYYQQYGGRFEGLGNLATGAILGYLLSQYLITPQQYDSWRNMNDVELKETLLNNGIVSEQEFGQLADRAWSDDSVAPFETDDASSFGDDFSDFGDGGFGD